MMGWCAVAGGTVVGFSLVFVEEREVNALFVDPQAEGCGTGSRLLDAATEWLRMQAKGAIRLCTGTDTPAYQFYLRRGWQDTGLEYEFGRVLELE